MVAQRDRGKLRQGEARVGRGRAAPPSTGLVNLKLVLAEREESDIGYEGDKAVEASSNPSERSLLPRECAGTCFRRKCARGRSGGL